MMERQYYSPTYIKQTDYDTYIAGLALPKAIRPHWFVVNATIEQLSRIVMTVSEPTLAQIRLQWWTEALEEIKSTGAVAEHRAELTEELALLYRKELPQEVFMAVISELKSSIGEGPTCIHGVADFYEGVLSPAYQYLAQLSGEKLTENHLRSLAVMKTIRSIIRLSHTDRELAWLLPDSVDDSESFEGFVAQAMSLTEGMEPLPPKWPAGAVLEKFMASDTKSIKKHAHKLFNSDFHRYRPLRVVKVLPALL